LNKGSSLSLVFPPASNGRIGQVFRCGLIWKLRKDKDLHLKKPRSWR
jgi:hypothetical protein